MDSTHLTQTGGKMREDRRVSHRVDLDIEVRVGNDPFERHSGDISIGGVFFAQPLNLPAGAIVTLRFSLPVFHKELEVKGEVVEITQAGQSTKSGTRVKFTELDLRSELLIAKYLDERLPAMS